MIGKSLLLPNACVSSQGCMERELNPRAGRRGWSGALLGAATLTKFFPLVIASALYRRWDWKMPLAFFAVAVGLYGFYAWFGGGGWHIFGSLPGYVSDEGFESGRGVFILTILRAVGLPRLPATLGFLAIAFAVMGTLFLRALFTGSPRPFHAGAGRCVRHRGDGADLAALPLVFRLDHGLQLPRAAFITDLSHLCGLFSLCDRILD
jgi:hypothetical protein